MVRRGNLRCGMPRSGDARARLASLAKVQQRYGLVRYGGVRLASRGNPRLGTVG
jgi:hypothetical protein